MLGWKRRWYPAICIDNYLFSTHRPLDVGRRGERGMLQLSSTITFFPFTVQVMLGCGREGGTLQLSSTITFFPFTVQVMLGCGREGGMLQLS
jgi:hypothetical protein